MNNQLIIALCALGGAFGGALGAYVTMRVTVALQGQKLRVHDKQIGLLQKDVSRHGERLADMDARISYLLEEVGRSHNEGMRARLHFLENRARQDK